MNNITYIPITVRWKQCCCLKQCAWWLCENYPLDTESPNVSAPGILLNSDIYTIVSLIIIWFKFYGPFSVTTNYLGKISP